MGFRHHDRRSDRSGGRRLIDRLAHGLRLAWSAWTSPYVTSDDRTEHEILNDSPKG
jgi:hypothetical protein